MKKLFFCLTLCLSLIACEDPSGEREAAKPGTEHSEKTGAGPYQVVFSGADQSYQHSFSFPIRQEEGKVEYYVQTPSSIEVEFLETRLTVSGCAASNVKHQIFWMPDVRISNMVYYLKEGESFRTQSGVRGSFVHLIRGLGGCTDINLTTKMRMKPAIVRPCKESNSPGACKVLAYCRANYPTNFTEAEIWQEPHGMSLRKYMNFGDGNRRLMASSSVSMMAQGNVMTYSNSSGDISLSIQEVTRVGTLVITTFGQPSTERLDCTP